MKKNKEQLEKVEDLEITEEQLSMEILQTREELQVISEVRDELVNLYGEYKTVEKLKDTKVLENEKLTADLKILAEELHDYKVAEEKLAAEKKLQELERLSAKFSALGQHKTVEQLQEKDAETLSEFEKIVDAALLKVGETAEMPSVTINSQEKLNGTPSEEEKPSEEVVQKPSEQLSNNAFFKGICDELSSEQLGSVNKRIKRF